MIIGFDYNSKKYKMKHVLFIITGLVGGGAEKALVNLLSTIDTTQYRVDVLVVFADNIAKEQVSGVSYYTLFDSNNSLWYKLAKHSYLHLHCSSLLKYVTRKQIRQSYDVIVSFLEGDSLLYHSFIFDRTKKNVSWVHTDFKENHWSQRHFVSQDEIRAYGALDTIVFVSEMVRQQFKAFFPQLNVPEEYVCPNIINISEVQNKAKERIDDVEKKRFTICSVGRLEEVKGYDMLIDAAVILQKRNVDVDFWIIGKGSQEQLLRRKLSETNVGGMVHFLGYKSNPYPYMSMADVLLSSSRAEGLPLFLLEAICMGKPILATKTVGAQELLLHSMYGKLMDITPHAIADAVQQIISNTEIYAHYLRASIEAKQRFDPNVILEMIDQILS